MYVNQYFWKQMCVQRAAIFLSKQHVHVVITFGLPSNFTLTTKKFKISSFTSKFNNIKSDFYHSRQMNLKAINSEVSPLLASAGKALQDLEKRITKHNYITAQVS